MMSPWMSNSSSCSVLAAAFYLLPRRPSSGRINLSPYLSLYLADVDGANWITTFKQLKAISNKNAEKDETAKEIKKHFPNAEVVPYFGDVKYFKDLNDGEQKVVSEEDFITTMKGFVELSGNDYDKAIELWELNKELFDLYKEKDSEKHTELMKWLKDNTKQGEK